MREPSLKARVLRYRILQCFQNLHRAWLLGFSLCSNRLSHGRCRTGHKGHKTVFYCSESDRKHAHMNIVNTACAPESCSKQSSSSIGSKFTRSRTLISPLGPNRLRSSTTFMETLLCSSQLCHVDWTRQGLWWLTVGCIGFGSRVFSVVFRFAASWFSATETLSVP